MAKGNIQPDEGWIRRIIHKRSRAVVHGLASGLQAEAAFATTAPALTRARSLLEVMPQADKQVSAPSGNICKRLHNLRRVGSRWRAFHLSVFVRCDRGKNCTDGGRCPCV